MGDKKITPASNGTTDDDPATKKVLALKEEGNEAYKNGDSEAAIVAYTKAVHLCEDTVGDATLAVCLKNRAAVHLKEEDYESVVSDCTRSLELCPNDPKALFRRAQAYEGLDLVEKAYGDAREVHRLDPNNKPIQPVLVRLHKGVSQKLEDVSKTSTKVKNMFEIVFDLEKEREKREKAADNLVVLARERAGAELLYTEGVIPQIARLMKVEKSDAIRLSMIRCIGELCKINEERSKAVLTACGIPFFLEILSSHSMDMVNASGYIIQVILDSISFADIQKAIKEKKKDPKRMSSDDRKWCRSEEARRAELMKKNKKELDGIMNVLTWNVTSRTITAEARDAIVELIMKNCPYYELDWADKMLSTDAYQRLMDVGSEHKEYKHESSMDTTDNTKPTVGACMGMLYDQMYDDAKRNTMSEQIDKWITEKLSRPSTESCVGAVVGMTTLLNGCPELGQSQISKEGVLSMMLTMAKTDDYVQQLAASEAIIASCQKKKDTAMIVQQGVDILKELYQSKNDHIKVRALVGLCKLGASAGHDASMRPFEDGSTTKLADACRRFLINPGKDRDLRKWAADGLSYLTLDADVKEKLVDDEAAIKALIELTKADKAQDCAYGVVTIFVNCTNSFEKQVIDPEMLELAKFAKHHIPEEHELDDQDFIDKRIFQLANYGMTSALVALSKTESKNLQELIGRVLNAICKFAELRGLVVQQGGSKILCKLAVDGNEKGMRNAAQALSRIGITQDPAIAFPGNRSCDIVRPLCNMLNIEYSGLENFEALMALGNLAGLNESTRKRMLKESDFVTSIENYMFEDHQLIRRAAVQAWTNLCVSPLQVKRCEGKNDKVKYAVLLCGDDEDTEVVKAASGGLAMLTAQSKKCCEKVFESIQWLECILNLLANQDYEVVLRGASVAKNMVTVGGDATAEKVLATEVMEVLQALIFKAKLDEGSYEPNPTLQKIKAVADDALAVAHKMKLIKTKDEAANEPEKDVKLDDWKKAPTAPKE